MADLTVAVGKSPNLPWPFQHRSDTASEETEAGGGKSRRRHGNHKSILAL